MKDMKTILCGSCEKQKDEDPFTRTDFVCACGKRIEICCSCFTAGLMNIEGTMYSYRRAICAECQASIKA